MGNRRLVLRLGIAAGAILLPWLYGAIHVVYGKGLGLATCWKQGWSFSDTFVDIERVSDAELLLTPKVIAALEKCKIVPDPDAWDRDKVIITLVVIAIILTLVAFSARRVWGDRD